MTTTTYLSNSTKLVELDLFYYLHNCFSAAGSAQDFVEDVKDVDLDFAQELCEAALTRLMDIKTRILNQKIIKQ